MKNCGCVVLLVVRQAAGIPVCSAGCAKTQVETYRAFFCPPCVSAVFQIRIALTTTYTTICVYAATSLRMKAARSPRFGVCRTTSCVYVHMSQREETARPFANWATAWLCGMRGGYFPDLSQSVATAYLFLVECEGVLPDLSQKCCDNVPFFVERERVRAFPDLSQSDATMWLCGTRRDDLSFRRGGDRHLLKSVATTWICGMRGDIYL